MRVLTGQEGFPGGSKPPQLPQGFTTEAGSGQAAATSASWGVSGSGAHGFAAAISCPRPPPKSLLHWVDSKVTKFAHRINTIKQATPLEHLIKQATPLEHLSFQYSVA